MQQRLRAHQSACWSRQQSLSSTFSEFVSNSAKYALALVSWFTNLNLTIYFNRKKVINNKDQIIFVVSFLTVLLVLSSIAKSLIMLLF
jgi:hypothetical protein